MTKQIIDYSYGKADRKILIAEEQNGLLIWLGNNETVKKCAGQIFFNEMGTVIESVAVLPQQVHIDSRLTMALHHFDNHTKTWGPLIASTTQQVSKAQCEEWLFFMLPQQQLQAKQWYGFKMICSEGLVAIAEGVHKKGEPEIKSMEWTAAQANDAGHLHHDFHLAYMVSLAA